MNNELRFADRCSIWRFTLVSFLLVPNLSRAATAASTLQSSAYAGAYGAETLSSSPDVSATGSRADDRSIVSAVSELSPKQVSMLTTVLRSGRKGRVNILWLAKVNSQGEQVASAFRDAGWTVASLPIGMGNLPSGITITGKASNTAVAAAKNAFDSSGVKYNYRDDETRTISPAMMGSCDVAITVSTKSK
jgi:hypothetical protein